jgi:hypothetical protein
MTPETIPVAEGDFLNENLMLGMLITNCISVIGLS